MNVEKNTLKYLKSLFRAFILKLDKAKLTEIIMSIMKNKSISLSPEESLKFLLNIDHKLYKLIGDEAIRFGNGLHTKHRHIGYHDFFVSNIIKGSSVLDIGCGIGALAYDIAAKIKGSKVTGIDIENKNIENAIRKYKSGNLEFIHGDALKELPDKKYDILVLSNVLEHIKKRVEFLRVLKKKYKPKIFLIRVPIFERDWKVPLKKELGVEYRLDDGHFIEYRIEEFFEEMRRSGLKIIKYQIKWGELWAALS
jgi:2-polyprenyl-3-methyl-5-hydroxy-6-metoxy-1,4-benzoquinol methylase